MKTWLKIVLVVLGIFTVFCVAGGLIGGPYLFKFTSVGAGRAAKLLCSNVFVSGRTLESVLQEELADMADYINPDVDYERKTVTATLGPATRMAVYREGLGCTILSTDGDVVGEPIVVETSPTQDAPWPVGDLFSVDEIPDEVDQRKLEAAIEYAFAEPHPDNPIKTRAVVIVYDGRIIAERYAPGFSQDTPQISWSAAKSVTNALVGILVREGKLSLKEPAPVPEWRDPSDPRHVITLDQLLRMSSGLEFGEAYGDSGMLANATSDVSVMLFNTDDMAAFAAAKPLKADPGTLWHYSSGTSNIVSQIVCDAVGGTPQDCLAFPRRALFDRIGMRSAVFEPDTSGTPVGASYVYATARDWARFGLLYLQDGVWERERILPEGWVTYTTTSTPGSEGLYGAHWWLDAGDGHGWYWPDDLPELFVADGHDGQFVIVVPSHNLVIVRLAFTQDPQAFNLGAFVEHVVEAIPGSK